jgi:histone H1/5
MGPALKKGVTTGKFIQLKGSYKLAAPAPKAKKAPAATTAEAAPKKKAIKKAAPVVRNLLFCYVEEKLTWCTKVAGDAKKVVKAKKVGAKPVKKAATPKAKKPAAPNAKKVAAPKAKKAAAPKAKKAAKTA